MIIHVLKRCGCEWDVCKPVNVYDDGMMSIHIWLDVC